MSRKAFTLGVCLGLSIGLAAQGQDSDLALRTAALKGDLATAERLVKSSVDPNVADQNGQAPLHFAAAFGHTKIVALLLDGGADVNIANKNGVTALLAAAQRGHPDVVTLLLAKGANLHAINRGGFTALQEAAQRAANMPVVSALLDAGANVNAQQKDESTALVFAIINGDLPLVDLLLTKGADPNRPAHGTTPLAYAVSLGHVGVARSLLKRGADPNARATSSGQSAADLTRQRLNPAMMKVFGLPEPQPGTLLVVALAAADYDALFGCKDGTPPSDDILFFTSKSAPFESFNTVPPASVTFAPDETSRAFLKCFANLYTGRGIPSNQLNVVLAAEGSWKHLFAEGSKTKLFVSHVKWLDRVESALVPTGGVRLRFVRQGTAPSAKRP